MREAAERIARRSITFVQSQAKEDPYALLQMGLLLGAGLTAVTRFQAKKALQVLLKGFFLQAVPVLIASKSKLDVQSDHSRPPEVASEQLQPQSQAQAQAHTVLAPVFPEKAHGLVH